MYADGYLWVHMYVAMNMDVYAGMSVCVGIRNVYVYGYVCTGVSVYEWWVCVGVCACTQAF